jgi:hypothetical protein
MQHRDAGSAVGGGWLALAVVVGLTAAAATAEAGERWRVDLAGHLRHFQQQVKTEVGAVRGERLVLETEVGLGLAGSYDVTEWLAAGAFVRADLGTRRAGQFSGIDDQGRTVVDPAVGGPYRELWLGPQVRGQWRMLFAELGYGLVTLRRDDARADLARADGTASGAFSTIPSVRWLVAAGASVELQDTLDLSLRLEWRIRYYDTRGGQPLADDLIHGTQGWHPTVGLTWRPGRR